MFSLSHCTTQEMVSLIFSHLFTSLSLKGIVITTPSGRGFRITPRGHVQNIPSCHPQSVLREQPLSFSLAYYAPATLPSVLKHAKFITSQDLLHLLFCLKSTHHSGISSNITSSVVTTPVPLTSHTLSHYPVLFSFQHFITIRNYLGFCLLLLIRAPKKAVFLNCSLMYPQCLEQSPVYSRY